MTIKEMIYSDKITLSFEVFPPKTGGNFENVYNAAMGVAALNPSYMSVTYGAGGSTRGNTLKIATDIQNKHGVATIAHLTCVGAKKEDIHAAIDDMKAAGIKNILALRGDKPKDFTGEPFIDYHYASELIEEIRAYAGEDTFCIGGACYPEGHVDAVNKAEDIDNLKKKVEAGCEFLTTQMFFDNNIFYNFLYRVKDKGITIPVIPGIMPITRATQVANAIAMSGTNMPERFRNLVDRFGDNPEAMQQAGIAYATDQIIDLIANGVNHIHVYSMNKPEVARALQNNLNKIIG